MKLGRKMIYWILQHSFTNTWQKFSQLSLVWLCFVLFTPDHGLSVSVELFLWYFSRISKLGLVLLQRCKYYDVLGWIEFDMHELCFCKQNQLSVHSMNNTASRRSISFLFLWYPEFKCCVYHISRLIYSNAWIITLGFACIEWNNVGYVSRAN